MGVNKYKEHVWVISEDDATRQLANGFVLLPGLNGTSIDIRPTSGGWPRVLEEFVEVHVANLRLYPLRHLVLLIDFDGRVEARAQAFRDRFPADVSERVYLLGPFSEPEPLRASVGMSLEKIGLALASECAEGNLKLWEHEMLRHNSNELARLTVGVKKFLFQ